MTLTSGGGDRLLAERNWDPRVPPDLRDVAGLEFAIGGPGGGSAWQRLWGGAPKSAVESRMRHVTPAPGTNQRLGRPGGHGGTHPARLLETLLCPIVGLWGALAAPLRAALQRGRWPRPVFPPTPAALPEGTQELRVQPVHGAAWGTHGRSRLCVPPPPPPPLAGRRPNNSKPPSLPWRDEPRPWLQSPPAAQPVSPAQGAGAATARGGPPG